jgi:polyisoprenoid-binding protein YceI
MKLLSGLLLLLMGYLPLSQQMPEQSLIEESQITFQIKNAGITVNGTLEGLQADIQLDPLHPEQAHIEASIPVSTIRTGIALRDKHLQKPDYFEAQKYPHILMRSKTIRKTGKGHYEGVFTLTIKDIEREVLLPFSLSANKELKGKLQVNRLDFGLGQESLVLANEVEISIVVKLNHEHNTRFIHK